MKRVQFYAIIAVLCVLVSGSALYADSYFQRGDANADGVPDIADAIFLLANLFSGGADPVCRDAADVNDDGIFDIADAIAILGHLFSNSGPLPLPFPECGPDPTDDTFNCASFPPCPGSTDDEPPTIRNVPDNITLENEAGLCSAIATWNQPTATDNVEVSTFTSDYASGDSFQVGITTVTYTATDTSGNQTTASFTVTVNDNENPVISGMPANISLPNDAGTCDAVVNWSDPSATDNCVLQSLVGDHLSGEIFSAGTTIVTYTATDTAGNTATASFTITVNATDSDGDGLCDEQDPCPDSNPDDANGNGICDSDEPPFIAEPPRNGRFGVDRSDSPGGVLLHSGEFTLSRVDLAIAGRGLGFSFVRSYRSGNPIASATPGPLGPGWDANVFRRLEILADGTVRRHLGNGRFDDYSPDGVGDFTSAAGVYSRLRNTGGEFQERSRAGTIHRYTLTGVLLQIEDRIGNTLTFAYDDPTAANRLTRVLDEFGREIIFGYSADGTLQSLTDFTGRSVAFTHGAAGKLIEARSPIVVGTITDNDFPLGRREQYLYQNADLPNHITAVILPNQVEDGTNTAAIVNSYGSDAGDLASFGRIISQQVGASDPASGSSVGGTLQYTFDFAPVAAPTGAVSRTSVSDRNGRLTDYFYSPSGHLRERVENPSVAGPAPAPTFVTTFEFNSDFEVTRVVRPLGNETIFTFDEANPNRSSQGNLLELRQIADANRGGDGAGSPINDIVTTFTYEPIFNQLLRSTDGRGNDPSYLPPNGGPQSAERYTHRNFYDWQEGALAPALAAQWGIAIDASLLNLGDLNGDGRTDQQRGLLVQSQAPAVNLLPDSNQALAEGDTSQERNTRIQHNDFGQVVRTIDAVENIRENFYFPASDPDGDGLEINVGQDPSTGGYFAGSVVDPTGLAITNSVTCDRRGNVLTQTDGRGLVTTHLYNALDERIQIEAPKVHPSQATGYLQQSRYDANGNRIESAIQNWTMTDGVPQLVAPPLDFFLNTTSYDILNRPVAQTVDARRDAEIPVSSELQFLTTRWFYDANENTIRTESPLAVAGIEPNNVIECTYDTRNLLIAVTRAAGAAEASTTTCGYDLNGNRTSSTDAEDNDGDGLPETESSVHDGFGRVVNVIDRAGNEQRLFYDPAGQVVRREFHQGPDATGAPSLLLSASTSLFDEAGRCFQSNQELFIAGAPTALAVTVVDGPLTPGDGQVSQRNEFDAIGRRTFWLEDDGAVFSLEHDRASRLIRSKTPLQDQNGNATETIYEYDNNHNLVKTVATHVSPEGLAPPQTLVTLRVYDAVNRAVRSTDTLGQTTYLDHDSRSNVLVSYDQRGAPVADPLGLYPAPESPVGVPALINDRGNPVRYFYDGASRCWLTQKELHQNGQGALPLDLSNPNIPSGVIALATEFDGNGRVVRRIDGNNNTTNFLFDFLNRMTGQTNADGGECTSSYDRDDNRISSTDENNTIHTFGYDALNRKISHSLTTDATKLIAGTNLPLLVGTTLQSWQYDGLSRLTGCFDNNDPANPDDDWTVTCRYDSLSRLIEENQNGTLVGDSFTADDRTALHYPPTAGADGIPGTADDGGNIVQFALDDCDQVTGVSDQHSQIETAFLGTLSAPIGRTTTLLNPPGGGPPQPVLNDATQLDLAARVVSSQAISPVGVIANQLLQYQRNNRLTQQSVSYEGVASPLNIDSNWQLTSFNQIRIEDRSESDAATGAIATSQHQMSYGPAQEIRQVIDVSGTGTVTIDENTFSPTYERTSDFQYNGADIAVGAATGTGIRSADTQQIYQWDAFNRLRVVRSATAPFSVIARYRYDAHGAILGGRRVAKQVTLPASPGGPPGGEVSTTFIYDGAHLIEERQPTIDPTGAPGAEQASRQFVYGYRGTDDILAMNIDSDGNRGPDEPRYYLKDANNNVTQLLDQNGTPLERYSYKLFESPTVHDVASGAPVTDSPAGNPYLFTGRRWEPEVGLYHYRARWFDPEAMEFLSRDLIGAWGDAANDGNGMAYLGNHWGDRRVPPSQGSVDLYWDFRVIDGDLSPVEEDPRERPWKKLCTHQIPYQLCGPCGRSASPGCICGDPKCPYPSSPSHPIANTIHLASQPDGFMAADQNQEVVDGLDYEGVDIGSFSSRTPRGYQTDTCHVDEYGTISMSLRDAYWADSVVRCHHEVLILGIVLPCGCGARAVASRPAVSPCKCGMCHIHSYPSLPPPPLRSTYRPGCRGDMLQGALHILEDPPAEIGEFMVVWSGGPEDIGVQVETRISFNYFEVE